MHYCERVDVMTVFLTTIFFVCFLGYIYTFYYKTILLASRGYNDCKILLVWHSSYNVRIAFPAF